MKIIIAAEALTGYVFNFNIYSRIGQKTRDTVMSLVQYLQGQEYHLYMKTLL